MGVTGLLCACGRKSHAKHLGWAPTDICWRKCLDGDDADSVQVEDYFDADLYGDWPVIFHRGGEAPFPDGVQRFLVEAHAERAHNAQVSGTAIGTNHGHQYDASLELGLACFIGVFGIGAVDGAGSRNASADVIDASTDAAAATFADTRTFARANASSVTAADATTTAGSIRRRIENVSHWVAVLVGLRQHQVGRTDQGGFGRQLRSFIANDDCGWRELLVGETRRCAVRCGKLVLIAATTSSVDRSGGDRENVVFTARDQFSDSGANGGSVFDHQPTGGADECERDRLEGQREGEMGSANGKVAGADTEERGNDRGTIG